jgi:chromate reductase, NAD(P)H dehydrogenase (quinone)
LLEAARRVAPAGLIVQVYSGVGALPHFNQDLDSLDPAALPPEVAELRAFVGRADALLLSTPEYAHGLPGAFKNALDWLVGSTEFPGKLVAVISPTARSTHAQAQLREVLSTMSARLLNAGSVTIALPRRDMDADEIAADRELSMLLRSLLEDIASAVRANRSGARADQPHAP